MVRSIENWFLASYITFEKYFKWILLNIVRDILFAWYDFGYIKEGEMVVEYVDGSQEIMWTFYRGRYGVGKVTTSFKYLWLYIKSVFLIIKYETGQWTYNEFKEFMQHHDKV